MQPSALDRFRTLVRQHYFLEAVVAYIFGMVSTWTPVSLPLKIMLTAGSAVLLVVAIVSKTGADRASHAERNAFVTLVRSLRTSTAKQPLIQVAFTWTPDEPKDKPFTIINAGDDEARNIRIHPIKLGKHEATFDPVGQLLPGASPATRIPRASHGMGLLFRTLIDLIERAVTERGDELNATRPQETEWTDQLARALEIANKARHEMEDIPVMVTYETRTGATTTLEYRLRSRIFERVSHAELEFLRQA